MACVLSGAAAISRSVPVSCSSNYTEVAVPAGITTFPLLSPMVSATNPSLSLPVATAGLSSALTGRPAAPQQPSPHPHLLIPQRWLHSAVWSHPVTRVHRDERTPPRQCSTGRVAGCYPYQPGPSQTARTNLITWVSSFATYIIVIAQSHPYDMLAYMRLII